MSFIRPLATALISLTLISCTTTPNPLAITATQKLIQFERSQSDVTRKTITLSTGERLTYLEGGNLAGEPLLLIHGFGGNKDNFTRIADELGDYHLIIPDLLGFGESAKPLGADYRSDAQARRLRELLEYKGAADGIHIGGNSMGGSISVAYAAMYPDSVKSLWLMDSAGFWSAGLYDKYKNVPADHNPLVVHNTQDYFKLFDLVMFDPPYIPKSVQAVFAQDSIKNQELHSRIIKQVLTDNVEARAEVIAEYNIPTLIVWGEKDAVLKPQTADLMQAIIPQANVIVMSNVGHVPMIEAVEQTAADYLWFRDGIKKDGIKDNIKK